VRKVRRRQRRIGLVAGDRGVTPPGGPTETVRLTESKGHPREDEVTCQVDDTKTFPDGVIHIVGTVTGFFTPAS
jgi:hypothetical protein